MTLQINRLSAAIVATALAVGASAVSAQVALSSGQSVQGRIEPGEMVCHIVATRPGTRWRITQVAFNNSVLELGRGTCDQLTSDRRAIHAYNLMDRVTRIEFAAGGGVYVIRTQGLGGGSGGYDLRIDQLAGLVTSDLLPAGPTFGPWLDADWTPASASSEPAYAGDGLVPGNIFKDCPDVCPELVVVPAGVFTMGSPDDEAGHNAYEAPRHPVAFAQAFAIGRHEVTFDEYDACVADGGCSYRPNDQGWGRGRRPVIDVSWNDAQAYVVWLSGKTGRRYALPSEAEWEYAARAGTDRPWHTGAALLTSDANILNSFARTVAVGAYPPNAFGLHDVHGNVGEWTLDCLDTGYVGVPDDGAAATAGDCAQKRVVRSGSFKLEPVAVRSAQRAVAPQASRHDSIGFRVTRAL